MADPKLPSHHGVTGTPNGDTYPNRTIELLLERASCRSYTDDPVPPETLRLILEAGARGFDWSQPWTPVEEAVE